MGVETPRMAQTLFLWLYMV